MKNIFLAFIIISFFITVLSCKVDEENNDRPSLAHLRKSSIYHDKSIEILASLRVKDYQNLLNYIHPTLGVRFSPCAIVDTVHDVIVQREFFKKLIHSKDEIINWGRENNKNTLKMTLENYFKDYVFDSNYLQANHVNYNRIHKHMHFNKENIKVIYPDANFVEFFCGSNESFPYWSAIRIVFLDDLDKTYLIGVIHDEYKYEEY